MNLQAIAGPDGEMVWVSGPLPGAVHDLTAARIWGISADEYAEKADVWPLNPKGELLLGLKLEDKYALANAEQNLKVPGIAFAEWGPGDMALSLGVRGPGNVHLSKPRVDAVNPLM